MSPKAKNSGRTAHAGNQSRASAGLKRQIVDLQRRIDEAESEAARLSSLFESAPLSFHSLDQGGHITAVNDNWVKMLGYSQEEITGRWFGDFLTPASVELFRERFPKFLAAGETHGSEYEMVTRDGSIVLVSVDGIIRYDEKGGILGTYCILTDITQQRWATEELKRADRVWSDTFDAIPDFISVHDTDFRILKVNRALASFLNSTPDELIGQHCYKVMHGLEEPWSLCPLKKSLKSGRVETSEIDDPHIGVPLEATTSPILDDKGEITGLVHIAKDISSARKAREEELKRIAIEDGVSRIFRVALTALDERELANVCLDIPQAITGSRFGLIGELTDDGRFDTIGLTYPGWDACKIPDSEATVLLKGLKVRGYLFGAVLTGESVIVNDPENHPDRQGCPEGHVRLISFMGVPLRRDGEVIGMIGLANKQGGYTEDDRSAVELLAVSIVEALMRRRAEDQVRRQRDQLSQRTGELQTLYRVSQTISSGIDMEKMLDQALDEIMGLELFDGQRKAGVMLVEGNRLRLVAHKGDGENEPFIKLHENLSVGDCLCGLAARQGEPVICGDCSADTRHSIRYPGMAPHGHVIMPLKVMDRVVGVLYLYTYPGAEVKQEKMDLLAAVCERLATAVENSKLYEETKHLSLHDSLTGLGNRYLMDIELQKCLAQVRRSKRATCSLIMFDLDHFKRYNDSYGHTAGDELLKDIAGLTVKAVREVDLPIRFGGEEFLIVLPATKGKAAVEVAERLRRRIESVEFQGEGGGAAHMTISLGVVEINKSVPSADEAIRRADKALYRAKAKGRNRVELWAGRLGS